MKIRALLDTQADPINEAEVMQDTITQSWVKDFLANPDDAYEPFSLFFYPIVDTAADNVEVAGDPQNKVVAVFGM